MISNLYKSTILIVDDSPENIDILNELLSNYNRKVAINGEKALEIANKTLPDLILLDIIMPGIDGFEVCKRLKEDNKTKNIPIIFMTVLSEVNNIIKGLEIGAVDYITKPFNKKELLSRVKAQITVSLVQKELISKKNILEQKVEERTASLQKANEELLIEKNNAEKSDKLKSEFLSQISHEIRTPINRILTQSYIITEENKESEDDNLTESLQKIIKSGRSLVRTFDLIFNYSSILSNSYDYSPTSFNLKKDIIDKIYNDYKDQALANNINFNIIAEDENYTIYADKYSLEQVFMNLIDNSLVYTNEGEISIKLGKENGKIFISISDTGIGICEEKLDSIFKPFQQEVQGYKRSYDGIGLGLTIVQEFCKMNNVSLKVETTKGEGSTFSLIFN